MSAARHPLTLAAVTVYFFALSAAQGSALATGCDVDQAGCKSNSEGDESELLQRRVYNNRSHPTYKFDQLKALAFAGITKLTYCSAEQGTAKSLEKTCGSKGFCRGAGVKVQKGSVRTISLPDGDSKNALVAVVAKLQGVRGAKNPLKPGCVAAVRGTWPGTNNGVRGKQTEMVPPAWGSCSKCRVHKGYQEIWKILMPAVTQAFKNLGCYKHIPIYVTGHSLGGAVATVGMYALRSSGWDVQPGYVFHNPKAGDAAWTESFNELIAGSPTAVGVTRVTHHRDNVPSWPWGTYVDGNTYAYTWPEVHYWDQNEEKINAKHEDNKYEVCWGDKSCGMLKYDKLYKESESDDHLINPLAPHANLAMFKDYLGTCRWGKGTVGAGDLPEQKTSAEKQLSWISQLIKPEATPCMDGWQLAADCKSSFTYYGQTINGCTQSGAIMTGMHWCSLDDVYTSRWNMCFPCGAKATNGWGWSKDEEEAVYNPMLDPKVTSGWR